MIEKLKSHWPEYLIEGALLGIFMLSACFFTALLEHPSSPLASAPLSPVVRRTIIGLTMGLTAIGLIYSAWGRRSGAHMNPAVTLTFLSLGKVGWGDAAFYLVGQFIGGALAMVAAAAAFRSFVSDPTVAYVQTQPGPDGVVVAFAAEAGISFVLMLVILAVSNSPRFSRWTGVCAGALVALYVSIEAPLSGMSMNPARSFASAFAAGNWAAIWLYFVAPPLGMLLAGGLYSWLKGTGGILCAKLHHVEGDRCLFCEHHKKDKGPNL